MQSQIKNTIRHISKTRKIQNTAIPASQSSNFDHINFLELQKYSSKISQNVAATSNLATALFEASSSSHSNSTAANDRIPNSLNSDSDLESYETLINSPEKISQLIDTYSNTKPFQLNLKNVLNYQKDFIASNQKNTSMLEKLQANFVYNSILFTMNELPIRLANLLKEMEETPLEFQKYDGFLNVYNCYKALFLESYLLKQKFMKDSKNSSIKNNLNRLQSTYLAKISEIEYTIKSSNFEDQLALAILDYKNNNNLFKNGDIFSNFLDRFFQSSIGIKTIITLCFSEITLKNQKLEVNSVFNEKLDLEEVAFKNYNKVLKLFSQKYEKLPELKFVQTPIDGQTQQNQEISYSYIPSHLDLILTEVLENAVKATMKRHAENSESIPAIGIEITEGETETTIRISDAGCGGTSIEALRWFNYHFDYYKDRMNIQPTENQINLNQNGLSETSDNSTLGTGFGLPISRLHARYLGGDLQIVTTENAGTDVFLTLKMQNVDKTEVLPNYQAGVYDKEVWDKTINENESNDWVGLNFNESRNLFISR